MKRFGSAVIDPRYVHAVVPAVKDPGTGKYVTYWVVFPGMIQLSLDADSAIALMAHLAGPAPAERIISNQPQSTSQPIQP